MKQKNAPKAVNLSGESLRAFEYLRATSKIGFNFSEFVRNTLIDYAKKKGMPDKTGVE